MPGAPALIGIARPEVLTVDLGGTKTRLALGSESIQPQDIDVFPTPHDYEQAQVLIAARASNILGGKRPDAVGFSVAATPENGVLVQAGQLAEYGWLGRDFAIDAATALSLEASNVVLLNDCKAGANAERVARRPAEGEVGAFMVVSTGFGGGLYTADELIGDEPGHEFLRAGAICGCGNDGCIEAHVSGSGIERSRGVKGEDLPHDDPRWLEIKSDLAEGLSLTLNRYAQMGHDVKVIGFTGSVALGGPNMISDLTVGLHNYAVLTDSTPRIEQAVYKEDSGLYGAYFAARDTLAA